MVHSRAERNQSPLHGGISSATEKCHFYESGSFSCGVKTRTLPLETVGIAFPAIGLGALQYVLDQGQEKD